MSRELYDAWEQRHQLSPSSPEAYYAEKAWNAAIRKARHVVHAAALAESTVGGLAALLEEELIALDTDL